MRILSFFSVSLLVTGCASMSMTPMDGLPSNMRLKPNPHGGSAQVVDSVKFDHRGAINESPAKCVAKTINNEDVKLSSTSTWVGPATGNIYNSNHASDSRGGTVLLYSDDVESVAAGREPYSFKSGIVPIQKSADFKVSIRSEAEGYSITFFDITAAQLNSGYAPNNGYTVVGAWAGARPLDLYTALKSVDQRLATCLSGA